MTLESAIALLADSGRGAGDVIAVLLKLATLAHITGHRENRDASVESAAELIARCDGPPRPSLN